MTLRDFATFETELESLEDAEFDEVSAPPGRVIAEHLVSRLRQAGAAVSHDVTPWEDYGWEFGVRSADITVSCVLQASDTWLLITRPVLSLVDRIRGRDSTRAHEAVCLALDQTLTGDPEIRSVRWYTRSEFERSPAS